jgi:DNA-binding GntR family transcriptional regulator
VTQFSPDEVRHLLTLRVELEALAFQWARPRVTAADLDELTRLVDQTVEAGRQGNKKQFLERDYAFHRRCWKLSGNPYLAETLHRLMAPLFSFVVVSSGASLTEAMGREHYDLIDALRSLEEPEFSAAIRRTLSGFASRWQAGDEAK